MLTVARVLRDMENLAIIKLYVYVGIYLMFSIINHIAD